MTPRVILASAMRMDAWGRQASFLAGGLPVSGVGPDSQQLDGLLDPALVDQQADQAPSGVGLTKIDYIFLGCFVRPVEHRVAPQEACVHLDVTYQPPRSALEHQIAGDN
jgi:hypothetical protein